MHPRSACVSACDPTPTHPPTPSLEWKSHRLPGFCVFGCGWVCAHIYFDLFGSDHYHGKHTLTQRRSARFRRDSAVRIWWSERLGAIWSGNGRWILQDLSEISGRRGRLGRDSAVSRWRSVRFGVISAALERYFGS